MTGGVSFGKGGGVGVAGGVPWGRGGGELKQGEPGGRGGWNWKLLAYGAPGSKRRISSHEKF